tara:strand:- start:1305 stop:1484 length:180 start_codon:yes stop_codon:yes gene_type:complete
MRKMKKYTAREMIDRLHELNVRLFEQVLDTIANADTNATGEWYDDEEGHMIMVEIGDEE